MFSLCDQAITQNPVVEDIVKQQAGPVLLLDAPLVQSRVAEIPYPDRHQRVAFERAGLLLGYPGENEVDIPANNPQRWLDFGVRQWALNSWKWILLDRNYGAWWVSQDRQTCRLRVSRSYRRRKELTNTTAVALLEVPFRWHCRRLGRHTGNCTRCKCLGCVSIRAAGPALLAYISGHGRPSRNARFGW